MAATDEPRLLALHGVRLGGLVDADRVAATTGLSSPVVTAELTAAVDAGLARRRDGRMSGWMLTAEGRAEGERLLGAELDAAGARAVVVDLYRRFLTVNPGLLATCTAWQVRDEAGQVPNDHTDAAYDAAVVARLVAVDGEVQPVCAGLAAALDRFDRYSTRLGHAVAAVQRGELDWFTSPKLDSFHTVWFELHEDLLATLGIERSHEGAGEGDTH